MSKKNNFRKTWRTLTEIGQEFGVSAVKFGNILKQHGLREKDGEPTQKAKDGGFFEKIVPNDGKAYYLWHRDKTVEFLVNQGVEKSGISAKEASKTTEARKLARAWMEAQQLDDEGSKLGYLMACELEPEIKQMGVELVQAQLKKLGSEIVLNFDD
ncbi:hypothetical protein F7734_51375 [Scytonema sp. UIC 10036]|uniref:hypothetical protein n=1 Tax=Scytonema sp. UIC 10036 TaxID=2304196 RepID=UPI0012DA23CE|nr:hypothetical protein [Scytonema sp. UIC 10036]MUH00232.1 hypothetical protein [Scytonema sp. UIC 10036]